jgi:hypothetical protein
MARPNGRRGWELTDEDVAEIARASGWDDGHLDEPVHPDRLELQSPGLASFTCPQCHRTSWNQGDVREGYCGACHDWTGTPR